MRGPATGIDIVPATPAHRTFIEAAVRSTYRAHATANPRHFTRKRLAPFLANIQRGLTGRGGPAYLIAQREGTAIGYISEFRPGRARTIQDIYVDPNFRGHGIAGAMLDHVIKKARTEGAGLIHATVWDGNDASRALFLSRQFAPMTPLIPPTISRLFPGLRSKGLLLTL